MATALKERIERRYVFSQKQIKEALGLKGNLLKMELWAGRSPKEELKGISPDKDEWSFVTVEGDV